MDGAKQYGINQLRETFVVREQTRRSMQGNRSTGTKPERALRAALCSAGLTGYRKNYRRWPGTPDVAWVGRKAAVFVHGCFWHGCPKCRRARVPATNADFWRAKLERNRERFERQCAELEAMGVRWLALWECEVLGDVAACVERVRSLRSG